MLLREKEELKKLTSQLEELRSELEAMNNARVEKTMEINNASKDIEVYFNALESRVRVRIQGVNWRSRRLLRSENTSPMRRT